MKYPKPIMKFSELRAMGFPEEFLMTAYRARDQKFATKINPTKLNSALIYDTEGLDAWMQKQIKLQVSTMPRG